MNRSRIELPQSYGALSKSTVLTACAALFFLFLPTGCSQNSGKPTASSAAWLHVGDPQNISGQPSLRNAAEYEQFRNTQAALIKSPIVLRAALDMPGISELPPLKSQTKPQQWLEDHLRVDCPKDTELLQIELPGENPEQAARIVNAVKQAYLENIVQAEQVRKLRSRELVENSYKGTMDQLQKKRELLNTLRQSSPASVDSELSKQRVSSLSRLTTDARARRLETDLQVASATARLARGDELTSDEKRQAQTDLAVAEAQRKVLDQAINEMQHQTEALLENPGVSHAQTDSMLEEIKQLESNAAKWSQELDRLKVELSLPQRVTSLQDAPPN